MNKNDDVYVSELKKIGVIYIYSIFFTTLMLLLFKPPAFNFLPFIENIIKASKEGNVGYFLEYLNLIMFSYAPLFTLILISLQSKIGKFTAFIFSIFIGIEIYLNYLQSFHAAWNVGFGYLMFDNVITAIENPSLVIGAIIQYLNIDNLPLYLVALVLSILLTYIAYKAKIMISKKNTYIYAILLLIIGIPSLSIFLLKSISLSAVYFLVLLSVTVGLFISKSYWNNFYSNKKENNLYIALIFFATLSATLFDTFYFLPINKINLSLLFLIFIPIYVYNILIAINNFMPRINIKFKSIAFIIFLVYLTFFITRSQDVPYFYRVFYTIEKRLIINIYSIFNPIKREDILIKDVNKTKQAHNIIFIMDESVRGDIINSELNKPNGGVLPFLKQEIIKHNFVNFGKIVSPGNCSSLSNISFISGGIESNSTNIKPPTIYQYMKNAGYKTYRIEIPKDGYYNGVIKADNKYIDVYKSFVKVLPIYERDYKGFEYILKAFKKEPNTKHFIYITLEGLHFPFRKSYPLQNKLNYSNPFENDYMSGIKWNVNEKWKLLSKIAKETNSTIVWMGDHGVNFAPDKGMNFIKITHCEQNFEHYKELYNVAGGIYSFNKNIINQFNNIKTRESSLRIFSTLLYLAGYNTKDIQKAFYYLPFNKNIHQGKYKIMSFMFINSPIKFATIDFNKKIVTHLNKKIPLPKDKGSGINKFRE